MPRPTRLLRNVLNRPELRTRNSPAALAGTVNDYDGGHTGAQGVAIIRVDVGGAARIMTGLLAGYEGQRITIINTSVTATQNLTLNHADAGSAAANRFHGANAAAVVVRAGGAIEAVYDGTLTAWRLIAI